MQMEKLNSFVYPPIFLSSSDAYSDVWELFFMLFKKYWPEYNGTIFFNTQEKEVQIDGLNIVCTKLGHLGSFGKEMRACLDIIDSDVVMIMCIDYIFMGKVNDEKVREYFEYFKQHNLDTLNFQYYNSINQFETEHPDLILVAPPALHFFNYQIAFWKKSVLYEMVLPYENPWTSEWYGARRAEVMKIKQVLVKESVGSPINYHQSGCLAKSKWHPVAVEFLKRENIPVDLSIRGIAEMNSKRTLIKILKTKKMYIMAGLKGSYWDLYKRRKRYY
jgi:hypothetical protein